MSNIGDKIKELRMISGMSQEALGEKVGVQRAAINKYEKGTVENVPLKTIEKMADVFDVSPTYIVGWDLEATNPLAFETKVIQGVDHFYGDSAVDLLETFVELNGTGQRRVIQYANDMVHVYSKVH